MSDEATFGIKIVGNNQVEKGAAAAEKRLSRVPGRVGEANKRAELATRASLRRQSRATLRTIGEVEQAGARIFGGRSITSGFASRLGGITQAARAAGGGLAEAAASGGILSSTMGAIGVAAGATIGILAAAGFAAFKLASGWAKGAASIGRTAEIIGVGTKQMQEFGAAAERVGVDKDKATGALGGLSQTLNDARYGRNTGALEVLRRLGVGMKLNKDGTVDTGAMLPAIADALARQNSSGRRTAAQNLGIDLGTLPVFTQGGKALSADMADADTHAPMISDAEIGVGKRIVRKGAMVGQLKDRAMDRAGKFTAEHAEVGYDAVLKGGTAVMDGARDFSGTVDRSFKPAAEKIEHAATKLDRTADKVVQGLASGASRVLKMPRNEIIDLKKGLATEWDKRSVAQGEGIIDTILNRKASGHWGSTIADVLNARSQFSDVNGPVAWKRGRHRVDQIPNSRIDPATNALVDAYLKKRASGTQSIIGDNLNYANPNYSDRRNLPWINRMTGPTLGRGKSIHRHGTTPELDRYRPGAFQVEVSQQQAIPVKVEIEMKGVPAGTLAKVTAGHGAPAISHAYAQG